jgi:hypothetical protein
MWLARVSHALQRLATATTIRSYASPRHAFKVLQVPPAPDLSFMYVILWGTPLPHRPVGDYTIPALTPPVSRRWVSALLTFPNPKKQCSVFPVAIKKPPSGYSILNARNPNPNPGPDGVTDGERGKGYVRHARYPRRRSHPHGPTCRGPSHASVPQHGVLPLPAPQSSVRGGGGRHAGRVVLLRTMPRPGHGASFPAAH